MDHNQSVNKSSTYQLSKEEKSAARETLQEMFHGSIDREVVTLILSESDYNVEDAIEKLFTLSNSSSVSATESISQKVSGAECRDLPEMVVPDEATHGWSKHPTDTTAYHGIDEISVDCEPKKQAKTGMSHVDQRLMGSGKSLLHSIEMSVSHDVNDEQKRQHNGESSTSHDVKPSEFAEPFQEFMKDFISANPSSDEWNSVKHKQNGPNNTGTKEEKEVNKHKSTGVNSCRTTNAHNPGTMNINDKSRTNSWRTPETSVNDMKHIGSTSLPMQLDRNQPNQPFYSQQYTHHPYSHTYNTQQFNPYQQKHPQMTQNYRPPYQSQPAPFVSQAYGKPYNQSFRQHIGHQGKARQQELAPRFNKQNARNPPFRLPGGKVMVIMRGLPGSGKSTFAESIKGTGVVYSTDDYFLQNGQYQFDGVNLGEAHEWNQIRAREAMKVGVSPVIIDNTNTEAWEMKPYVAMAQRLGYQVILKEPNTSWRWNPKELFRRNRHGVSLSAIKNMMDRYEHDITVEQIMHSAKINNTKSKLTENKPSESNLENSAKQEDNGRNETIKPDQSKETTTVSVTSREKQQNKTKTEAQNPKINKHSNEHSQCQEVQRQSKFYDKQRNRPSQNNSRYFSPQRNTNTTGTRNKSSDHETAVIITSHGSRSPTREFENYMADEQPRTTSLPKPQRERKKRERMTLIQESQMSSGNIVEAMSVDCSKDLPSQDQKGDLITIQHTNEKEQEERIKGSLVDQRGCSPVKGHTGILKSSLDSDLDSETDNKDSCSQSTADDAYNSDDEHSDSIIVESDDDDIRVISDDSSTEKLTMNESPQFNFEKRQEDTGEEKLSQTVKLCEENDVELSGFEFLNTCFPDIDDKILVEILAEHNGDINKAIEIVLHNSERFTERETSQESDSSNESGSDSFKDDLAQSKSQQDKAPLPTSHQPSFQMSLEPVVAFHLFELFGPIQEVNSKGGEFSASDLSVTVDMDFAKLLYQQWKKSIQRSKGIFKEDNAPRQSSSPSFPKRKQRTVLKLHERRPPPPWYRAMPTDLREIMHEQLAIEQSRQEQNKQEPDLAVVLKRQKLFSMFPGVDPTALEELFQANNYELEPTVAMVQTSCSIVPKEIRFIQDEADSSDDWKEVLLNGHQEPKTFQTLEDPGYIDFRGEANIHHQLRDECFKKAALAFSQKQGQLAQYYARQGHRHTEKIREANERAAARILEHKNADKDRFVLDLHGLHVPEAIQALQERLNLQDSVYKPRYISVVTGRGLHSKHGKAKIKPAVLKYLQDNNYRHEEMHAGQIKVYLK